MQPVHPRGGLVLFARDRGDGVRPSVRKLSNIFVNEVEITFVPPPLCNTDRERP